MVSATHSGPEQEPVHFYRTQNLLVYGSSFYIGTVIDSFSWWFPKRFRFDFGCSHCIFLCEFLVSCLPFVYADVPKLNNRNFQSAGFRRTSKLNSWFLSTFSVTSCSEIQNYQNCPLVQFFYWRMLPGFLLVSYDGCSQFSSDALLTFWFAVLHQIFWNQY